MDFRVYLTEKKVYFYGSHIVIYPGYTLLIDECGCEYLVSMDDIEFKTGYVDFYGQPLYTDDIVLLVENEKIGTVIKLKGGDYKIKLGKACFDLDELTLIRIIGKKELESDMINKKRRDKKCIKKS